MTLGFFKPRYYDVEALYQTSTAMVSQQLKTIVLCEEMVLVAIICPAYVGALHSQRVFDLGQIYSLDHELNTKYRTIHVISHSLCLRRVGLA